jgi:hypothetical protein
VQQLTTCCVARLAGGGGKVSDGVMLLAKVLL